MKCRNCGSEIPDGTLFCYVCGEKVTDIAQIQKTQTQTNNAQKNFNIFKNSYFDNLKETTSNISKSTKEFVENTGATISSAFKDDEEVVFEKYGYNEALEYLHKNNKTKIAFPASDSQTKDKLDKLFSGEVIGTGAGLVGAAATIGLIGSTLGQV